MVDGKILPPGSGWVQINTASNALYGIVTDAVINEQPATGYNLTIRAYDSTMLYVDAPLIVRIDRGPLIKYYQFTLYLTLKESSFIDIFEYYTIVSLANAFFKSNLTNAISLKKSSAGSFSLQSSICTLSQRCDNPAATSIFNKMIKSGSSPQSVFAKAFLPRYTLTSVTTYTDQACKLPQNPPVPLVNPWVVSATYCGKMNVLIPNGIFTDAEDGNTRSLKVELFTSDGKTIPKTSWVQINSTSQVSAFQPFPTDGILSPIPRSWALSFQSLQNTINQSFMKTRISKWLPSEVYFLLQSD